MQWQRTEFILKGIFLGFLVFIALQEPRATWLELAYVGISMLVGLVLFLGIAALRKLREGYHITGRRLAFLLFLLLENPGLVYAGVLVGQITGIVIAFYALRTPAETPDNKIFFWCVVGGAILGGVFFMLRHVEKKMMRFWMSLALGAALVGGVIAALHERPDLISEGQRLILGSILLMGIPVFYLLTFASLVEESEVEIAAMCAALGGGLWLLGEHFSSSYFGQSLALALPVVLYWVYTTRILPGLRVFKHVLRGMSYASVGRYRWALISLGRAMQLDPSNKLAQEELWDIHRQMDLDEISNDVETLALVNFELCLERAASLLVNPPARDQLDEAQRLLNLVSSQRPEMLPRCDYWRAVANLHQKKYEEAAEALERVVAGTDSEPKNPHRLLILLPAWRLALLDHPEMKRRVGQPQLQEPGRRMEAIAAVERHLAENPEDSSIWELKRMLYQDLTEGDYESGLREGKAATHFDHQYVYQQGMALIGDSERWERGAEYLRIAAHGLPEIAPSLFVTMAKASQKAEQNKAAWQYYELAKQAGSAAGPDNLSDESRAIYFQVVKMLGDSAREDGEVEKAIDNYRLLLDSPAAGVETYRILAELYEKKGDVWSALHATEHAFIHGKKNDPDLLERKDRYYYSITPEDLRSRWEKIQKWFDMNYCMTKARNLLDRHGGDLDLIEWAAHLLELAHVADPSNMMVRLLRGRVRRLKGENEAAIKILEEIRSNKPERFPSSEEEEAWYAACKLLGDLYLNDKPEQAVECFLEYKQYPKSGADTYYKLGVAYEALGDWTRAAKCYEQVTAYESHPLASSAHDALDRLRAASG